MPQALTSIHSSLRDRDRYRDRDRWAGRGTGDKALGPLGESRIGKNYNILNGIIYQRIFQYMT